MNRHENIVCKGCSKMDFTGRCYRCLSCLDFNMCAECYDNDFTTVQHLFDHPVKCILTPADVELYFGGEYLNDPPQSYRCPYCKQWGYNESTFLEHVTAEHVDASTLLVSTMVTLFEQQQAARLFLEDEQLAVIASAATSRNELMNRSEVSLDLYLEPLNPNGSYQREHRIAKPADEGGALAPTSNNNLLIPDLVRSQSLLDRSRHRPNFDRPPLFLQQQQHHQHHQQRLSSGHPTLAEMVRFNEPLPTTLTSRSGHIRVVTNQASNRAESGRSVNLIGPNATADQRHSTSRIQMETFPTSNVRQIQRLRGGPGLVPAPGHGQAQRLEFRVLANRSGQPLAQNVASGSIMLRTIEEEELQYEQQLQLYQQPSAKAKQLQLESQRFLCSSFLSSASNAPCPSEEQITFLAQRAEFVAQLLASVLCEEELTGLTAPIVETDAANLRNRFNSEFVGAGDAELDLTHTTPCKMDR